MIVILTHADALTGGDGRGFLKSFFGYRMIMRSFWLIVLAVNLCGCEDDATMNKSDAFVPTAEWQVVKKGQAIPRGLHVRMNLEKEVTEAKLMDPKENHERSLTQTTSTPTSSTKFKTLSELKAEFSEMKMEARSDAELMHELLKRYENVVGDNPLSRLENDVMDTPSSVELLAILEDFEYLVHQYDNALEFLRLNGFENVIYPHLNSSEDTLKAEALKLLASCVQNHIKVQVHALETNAGEKLLKILSLDDNEYVKARAVYALGGLLRGFPLAQKQIIGKHGMDVFHKILLSDNPNYFKLKIPIIVLLDDLVLEHRLTLEFHVPGKPEDEEKLRQYYEVDLMSKLSDPVFCDILTRLLEEYFEYDKTDMDSMDKITSAIKTFGHFCKHHHYKDKKLLSTFLKIQTTYRKLMKSRRNIESEGSGEDLEYYSNILDFIDNYINLLNDVKLRDEL